MEENINELLGNAVKKARLNLGATQLELARLCNVSKPTISNIEQGRNMPSFILYLKLCKILSISCDEFKENVEVKDIKELRNGILQKKIQALKKDLIP